MRIDVASPDIALSGTVTRPIKAGVALFERLTITRLLPAITSDLPIQLTMSGIKKAAALQPAVAMLTLERSEVPSSMQVPALQ